MNTSNMVKYAIGLVVGLTMIAGLVVPVVESSQNTIVTIENNSTMNYAASMDAGYSIEGVSGSTNIINGVTTPHTGGTTWVFSDHVQVRIGGDNRTSFICPEFANTLYSGEKITFANGVVTITTAAYSGTFEYTHLYVPSATGTYGAFYNNPFGANNSSEVFIVGLGFPAGNVNFTGTYSATKGWEQIGSPFIVNAATAATPQDYNVKLTATPSPTSPISYTLHTASGVTWEYIEEGEEPVDGTTANQIFAIAPIEYRTLEPQDYGAYALLSIIPLMGIVVLIVFAASTIRSRRY